MRKHLACFLAVAGFLAAPVCRGAGEEKAASPLASDFNELVGMTHEGEWGAVEWARGSLLGIRVYRYGSAGVPHLRGRFVKTSDANEAFLSGAFVAIHGDKTDHLRMRSELETAPGKRAWLKSMVGDGKAMTASLQQGEQWRQAADYFPSLGGCRSFCLLCMESADALVRRAGLYWGYWVSDAAYWKKAQSVAKGDKDELTRKFAAHLLKAKGAK